MRSLGANSPNIGVNSGSVTYRGAPAEKRPPKLTLRQHFAQGTPHGSTEIFIFTNDGDRTTGMLDIRVLDDNLRQVVSYRGPLEIIAPRLPANIEPGHAREFTAKITADQIARAKWIEWQWESVTERAPWHATDAFESVADTFHFSDKVDATFQKLKVRQEYAQYRGGVFTKGITFTNDTDKSVAVLDLRVLDASSVEVVNFRRPHGHMTPALPLNVEPHHALLVTVQLTQEQASRGAWLEWEEAGGDKQKVEWTHRDVSVDLSSASGTGSLSGR